MNKAELEDAINEAVALGMAHFASIAVEEGYVTDDEALYILEKSINTMRGEHDEFHRREGTTCDHGVESRTDGSYVT